MYFTIEALKQKRRKFWQNFFELVLNREALDLPDIKFAPPKRRSSNNNMGVNEEDETDIEFGTDDPDSMDADEDESDIDIGVEAYGISFQTFVEQTEDEENEDVEYEDDEYENEEIDITIEYGLIEMPKIISIDAIQDVDGPVMTEGDDEVCQLPNPRELTWNRPLGNIIERNTPTVSDENTEVDRLDTYEFTQISPKKENIVDPNECDRCVTPTLSFTDDFQAIKMEEESNTELDIKREIKEEKEDDTDTVIVNINTGVNADVLELKQDLKDFKLVMIQVVEENRHKYNWNERSSEGSKFNFSDYSFSDEEIQENTNLKNQLISYRIKDNYILNRYIKEWRERFANHSFSTISEWEREEQNTSRDKRKKRLKNRSALKKSRNNRDTSDSDSSSEATVLVKRNLNISKNKTNFERPKNQSSTHSVVFGKSLVKKSRNNHGTSDSDSSSGDSLIIKQNLNILKNRTRSAKSKNKLQNLKTQSDVFVKSTVKKARNNHDTSDSDSSSGGSLKIKQNLNISKNRTRSAKSKNKLQNSKTQSDVFVKSTVKNTRNNYDASDSDSSSGDSLIIKQNLNISKNSTKSAKSKNKLQNSKIQSDVFVKSTVKKARNNHDTSDSDSSSGDSLIIKQNLNTSKKIMSHEKPKNKLKNSKTQSDVFVNSAAIKSRYNLLTSDSKSQNSNDSMLINDTTISKQAKRNVNNSEQHIDFFIKSPAKNVQDADVSESSNSSESILVKYDLNSNHTIDSPSHLNRIQKVHRKLNIDIDNSMKPIEEFLKKKQQKSNLHEIDDTTPKTYKNTKSQLLDQSKNASISENSMNVSCKSNKIEMNKRGNTSKNLRHFEKVLSRKRTSSPIKRCHLKKLKVDVYFQNKSLPNVAKKVRNLDSNSFFSDELW